MRWWNISFFANVNINAIFKHLKSCKICALVFRDLLFIWVFRLGDEQLVVEELDFLLTLGYL